jgi:hypothetical protein
MTGKKKAKDGSGQARNTTTTNNQAESPKQVGVRLESKPNKTDGGY